MTIEKLRKDVERAMRGDDLNDDQPRCGDAFDAIIEYLEEKEKESKEPRHETHG